MLLRGLGGRGVLDWAFITPTFLTAEDENSNPISTASISVAYSNAALPSTPVIYTIFRTVSDEKPPDKSRPVKSPPVKS